MYSVKRPAHTLSKFQRSFLKANSEVPREIPDFKFGGDLTLADWDSKSDYHIMGGKRSSHSKSSSIEYNSDDENDISMGSSATEAKAEFQIELQDELNLYSKIMNQFEKEDDLISIEESADYYKGNYTTTPYQSSADDTDESDQSITTITSNTENYKSILKKQDSTYPVKTVRFAETYIQEELTQKLNEIQECNSFDINSPEIKDVTPPDFVLHKSTETSHYSPKVIATYNDQKLSLCPLCKYPRMIVEKRYHTHLQQVHGVDENGATDWHPLYVFGDKQDEATGEIEKFEAFVCPRDRCNFKISRDLGSDATIDYEKFLEHVISNHSGIHNCQRPRFVAFHSPLRYPMNPKRQRKFNDDKIGELSDGVAEQVRKLRQDQTGTLRSGIF